MAKNREKGLESINNNISYLNKKLKEDYLLYMQMCFDFILYGSEIYKGWSVEEMKKFVEEVTPLRKFAANTKYLIDEATLKLKDEIDDRRN